LLRQPLLLPPHPLLLAADLFLLAAEGLLGLAQFALHRGDLVLVVAVFPARALAVHVALGLAHRRARLHLAEPRLFVANARLLAAELGLPAAEVRRRRAEGIPRQPGLVADPASRPGADSLRVALAEA